MIFTLSSERGHLGVPNVSRIPQDGFTKTMRTKLLFRIYKLVVSLRISRMVRFALLIPEERDMLNYYFQ